MKNLIILVIAVFITSASVSQNFKKNTYFSDGEVIEATIYHENGMVAQTGYYTPDNKLTGEWVSYDITGNKTAIAQYNNGEKTGAWVFYDGDIKHDVSYEESRIAKVTTWKIVDPSVVLNNL